MRNKMAGQHDTPAAPAATARQSGRWLIPVAAAVAALAAVYGYNATMTGGTGQALPANPSDIAALEQATMRQPDNIEIWKQLAQAQRRAGNTAGAITALVRAARIDPDDTEVSAALRDLSRARR